MKLASEKTILGMPRGSWATLVVWFIALLIVSPVILMFVTSFKPEAEVLNPKAILPAHPTLDNYKEVLKWSEEAPFARWLMNSVFVSSSVTLLVVAFSSMAAFSLSRLNVPGGKIFLTLVVIAMMIPSQLFLVPVYFILGKLHWLDTPAALIVPATAGGWGVFMLTQFMQSVPQAVEEAAMIDGCTSWKVFWNVSLPLCQGPIAALAIFTFIGSWNDYISPLVFLDSVRNYTLPVGIALYQASYYTEYGRTLATSVLASTPLLLFFLLFQRQIVASMASTGLKD